MGYVYNRRRRQDFVFCSIAHHVLLLFSFFFTLGGSKMFLSRPTRIGAA